MGYRPGEPSLQVLTLRDWMIGLEGHRAAERPAWERCAHLLSAWSEGSVSADDLAGPLPWQAPTASTDEADYEALKASLLPLAQA